MAAFPAYAGVGHLQPFSTGSFQIFSCLPPDLSCLSHGIRVKFWIRFTGMVRVRFMVQLNVKVGFSFGFDALVFIQRFLPNRCLQAADLVFSVS